MSDRDEIKELFSKELKKYSAEVDPSVWSGVSQSLGSSVSAGTAVSKLSFVSKVLIVSSVSAIIGVSTYVLVNSNKSIPEKRTEVSKVEVEKINNSDTEELKIESSDKTEKISIQQDKGSSSIVINEENNVTKIAEKVQEQEQIIETNNNTQDIKINELVSSTLSTNNDMPTTENVLPSVSEEETASQEPVEENTVPNDPLYVQLKAKRKSNQHFIFEIEASEHSDTYLDLGDGKIIRGTIVEYVFDEPGKYIVQAISSNGLEEVVDEVSIEVKMEGKFTNLPNVFSPNGDGVSDEFFIQQEGIEDFQLTIFNQKSEVVFETNEIDFKWKGFDKRTQQLVPAGNYYYIIIAQDKAGNVINKHQTLSIFRN